MFKRFLCWICLSITEYLYLSLIHNNVYAFEYSILYTIGSMKRANGRKLTFGLKSNQTRVSRAVIQLCTRVWSVAAVLMRWRYSAMMLLIMLCSFCCRWTWSAHMHTRTCTQPTLNTLKLFYYCCCGYNCALILLDGRCLLGVAATTAA